MALLRKPDVSAVSKRRIADLLISIWDDSTLEIDDFAPILESAWHARNRITSDFGCLVGATETFRLVCEDCSSEVLEFFARDGMTDAETQAFEEFLFNMTWEELNTLRARMRAEGKSAVSPKWAAGVLGRPIDELEHSREMFRHAIEIDPENGDRRPLFDLDPDSNLVLSERDRLGRPSAGIVVSPGAEVAFDPE